MNKNVGKLLGYIGIPVVILVIVLRFALFYFKSNGFSGIAVIFPLLAIGTLIFALLMSSFFSAWVYQDCKKKMMMVFFGQSSLLLPPHLLGCLFTFYATLK